MAPTYLSLYSFFIQRLGVHLPLHSFPTRRSSDLAAPAHEGTAHRRVRRGRRSRSRQARPDGYGGREARGHRDRHVGQSAHRGPGEDPRRRGGRHAGQAAHPRGRPPPCHRPRPRAGTAGRHDPARGERARDLPGDRDGEAAVRRAGDRAGAGGLVTQWTSARVAEALGVRAPAKLSFGDVATDTRDLRPGALFVALKGDRFDAHAFLDQARARGASAAVVRRGTPAVDGLPYFEVADTLDALGLLARARRRLLAPGSPGAAVRGRSENSSTKEMIRAVPPTPYREPRTGGNVSSRVGVPLTSLAAPKDAGGGVGEGGGRVNRKNTRLNPPRQI